MATGLAPHHNHQCPSHVQKPSSQSSCQIPPLSSMFAENCNNLNPRCRTSAAPPLTLDFNSAVPNFSNEDPSSSSITTENSLLMNPSSVYYLVKDNILMLGSEGSSNSSSEHCTKQVRTMGFQNYFAGSRNEVEPSIDDSHQSFLATGYGLQGSNQANNFWAEKMHANFGENVPKYDIEDVKKVIHRAGVLGTPSSASINEDDEEKGMYYF